MENMEKFAVAITIAKVTSVGIMPTGISSQLYIINSPDKQHALGFVMEHADIKKALKDGYFIAHTNVALVK